jgi:hypothetical protein
MVLGVIQIQKAGVAYSIHSTGNNHAFAFRTNKPMAHPRRKPRKIALLNGEPTRRACKRAVLLKKHMSSSAGRRCCTHGDRSGKQANCARTGTCTQASHDATHAGQPAQKPAPTTTAAPAPAPARQPPASTGGATLEAGQFADDVAAKASCPSDTVVWVNLPSKIYHFAGTKSYGTTKRGAYMCEKTAIAAENRA